MPTEAFALEVQVYSNFTFFLCRLENDLKIKDYNVKQSTECLFISNTDPAKLSIQTPSLELSGHSLSF